MICYCLGHKGVINVGPIIFWGKSYKYRMIFPVWILSRQSIFQANGKIINEFEVELKRDERILRWQTVKLDKYALEYAATRRTKLNNNKES